MLAVAVANLAGDAQQHNAVSRGISQTVPGYSGEVSQRWAQYRSRACTTKPFCIVVSCILRNSEM